MVRATQVGLYLHDWAGLGYKNGPRNTGIHVNVGHCPAHMNSSLINIWAITGFLKVQCHEIFDFWFFPWISFPQASEYNITAISNFSENSRRYSRLKVHHQCLWHRWQMEKIFKEKNFHNFVWAPLGSRVNIYIRFCLQVHFKVSAAWYYSHYLPPVSLTPVANLPPASTTQLEQVAKFAAGVVDIGGKFATGVTDTGGAPWLANISKNFRKNLKWPLCYFQGLGGRLFMKKTWSKKSRDTVPLNASAKSACWQTSYSQSKNWVSCFKILCTNLQNSVKFNILQSTCSLSCWCYHRHIHRIPPVHTLQQPMKQRRWSS